VWPIPEAFLLCMMIRFFGLIEAWLRVDIKYVPMSSVIVKIRQSLPPSVLQRTSVCTILVGRALI
jgi:hypothetical protein